MGEIQTHDLVMQLNRLLRPDLFKDYAPNGLQVEGRSSIRKLITGVTASASLIDAAIERQADAILVHHGYFWKGENPCLLGYKAKRLKKLFDHNINLIAYHLPLDAHASLGNNWQLGLQLGIKSLGVIKSGVIQKLEPSLNTQLLFVGELPSLGLGEIQALITSRLGRPPLVIEGTPGRLVQRVAWCTGAAQASFLEAVDAGVDLFITGEVSERTYYEAKETGVHFIAAGHNATERFGVQAVGIWLTRNLELETMYIDIENPV